MSNHDRADDMAAATTEELRGLIASSKFHSTRKVAAELGISYSTLTRNISGENPIKLSTMYRILDLLQVSPQEFMDRVTARVNRQA